MFSDRRTMVSVFVCILASMLAGGVKAFPSGAPFDTCLSMFPKHKGQEQQSIPPPFSINLSPEVYSPGQNITVTITATMGHVFRGIQIRGHRADVNAEETVGMFVDWPEDKVQPISCFGVHHNMITHKNNEIRTNITLTWTTPEENIGALVLKVTLVESFKMFWSQLTSPLLQPSNLTTVVRPRVLQSVVNTSFEPIDWSACGKTKGCLLYPRHCHGDDCYAGVTFVKVAEGYTFEMFAEGEGYVAVGVSHDASMGKDHTIACTAQGERVSVQNGFNHDAYNERMMGIGLTNLQTMQADGVVYCRFTRPQAMQLPVMSSNTGDPDIFSFDLDIDYFLFLAWGYTLEDSDSMRMHTELPIISDEKINFRHYAVYRGSSIPFQPKVHGCLMMVAWIGMAGVTVVLSRYFREGAGATFCLGIKLWFQLHRLSALLVIGLTASGLVLILIHLKGEITQNEQTYNHACVGFTVVALVCAQVLFGLFRPSLTSKFRFLFNWGHRILGKIAQILSAVALVLAFQWEAMPRVARDFGVTVLACWIGAQVLAEVALEIWFHCGSRKTSQSADLNMDAKQAEEKSSEGPWRNPSSVPVVLYLLVPVTCVIAGLCSLLLF